MKILATSFLVLAVGLAAPNGGALGEEADRSLSVQETWGTVFADRAVSFHVLVGVKRDFRGRIGWRFSFRERTLARGELSVDLRAGTEVKNEIRFDAPQIKEGAVLDAALTVGFLDGQPSERLPVVTKRIWIFGEDPFLDRRERLKELRMTLFDPERKTLDLLNECKVPCRQISDLDALPETETGLFVVGEGLSLKDYRGLAGAMLSAASRGIPVLCLAPTEGTFPLPGGEDRTRLGLRRLTFGGPEVIGSLDKRLDWRGWPSDGAIFTHSMRLIGERGPVTAEVTPGTDGWSWLELDFGREPGRLVVCEFRIVDKWDCGPTPRFLFARLLEYLTERRTEK